MALLLAIVLAAGHAAVKAPASKAPDVAASARLSFRAGDLAKAVDWASHCVRAQPEVCRPLLKALAEYGLLANHTDELTVDQARDFIRYDRVISPEAPGRITKAVIARFVTGPLSHARDLAAAEPERAKALVDRVLEVDPSNADASELRKSLK